MVLNDNNKQLELKTMIILVQVTIIMRRIRYKIIKKNEKNGKNPRECKKKKLFKMYVFI